MSRVTTFTQSPDTITPSELNIIQDDYEKLFLHKRYLHLIHDYPISSSGNQERVLDDVIGELITGGVAAIDTGSLFYWDPSDWESRGSRALRMKMRVGVFSHGTTALGATVTTFVRKVSTFSGTGGTFPTITMTLAGATPGLTVTIGSPSAGNTTIGVTEKTDAETMLAGFYVVTAANSVAPITGSRVAMNVEVTVTMA